MSKQSEAKEKKGYEQKPILRVCMNCDSYHSDMVKISVHSHYTEEKNKRCLFGGFVVKKMATCNEWFVKDALKK